MGATNKTANYELPQFVASDIPSWLNDVNGAMTKIDTAMKTVEVKADGATTASSGATSQVSALSTTVTNHSNQITALQSSVSANDAKVDGTWVDISSVCTLTVTNGTLSSYTGLKVRYRKRGREIKIQFFCPTIVVTAPGDFYINISLPADLFAKFDFTSQPLFYGPMRGGSCYINQPGGAVLTGLMSNNITTSQTAKASGNVEVDAI